MRNGNTSTIRQSLSKKVMKLESAETEIIHRNYMTVLVEKVVVEGQPMDFQLGCTPYYNGRRCDQTETGNTAVPVLPVILDITIQFLHPILSIIRPKDRSRTIS